MKKLLQISALVFLSVTPGCNRPPATPAYGHSVDLTGEWAIEWEDKKRGEKETIYVWITQREDGLTGSALDPNLIPADVAGQVQSGQVTFNVGPKSGRGFHAPIPPVSRFNGTITGTNAMEGRYRVRGQRGPWRATRTATGTNRTVLISAGTKLVLPLTSEEYDLLFHPLSLETDPAIRRPLSTHDTQNKESRRVGDHFEVEETVGELGGWIYKCQILGNYVRISPEMSKSEQRLQEKILRFLNQHGYPWKSIPP